MKQEKKDKRKHKMGQLKMQFLGLVPSLYTVAEAAKILKTTRGTIYNLSYRYDYIFKKSGYGESKGL